MLIATTQRTFPSCSLRSTLVRVDAAGGDGGGDLEVFGTVSVRGASGTPQLLASWSTSSFRQIAEGVAYPATGTIGEAIVGVVPASGNNIAIATDLYEWDTFSDDSFGGVVDDAAPFESGWRRTLYLHRAAGTQQITLQVSRGREHVTRCASRRGSARCYA
jgi:hypothetical protein